MDEEKIKSNLTNGKTLLVKQEFESGLDLTRDMKSNANYKEELKGYGSDSGVMDDSYSNLVFEKKQRRKKKMNSMIKDKQKTHLSHKSESRMSANMPSKPNDHLYINNVDNFPDKHLSPMGIRKSIRPVDPDIHIKRLFGQDFEFSEKYLTSDIDPKMIVKALK